MKSTIYVIPWIWCLLYLSFVESPAFYGHFCCKNYKTGFFVLKYVNILYSLFSLAEGGLSAFSTTARSVHLEPNQTSTIEVRLLPFQVGKKQCSILFINEQIGEFIYTVEATVTLPLSQVVPHKPGEEGSVRISSAAAAGKETGINLKLLFVIKKIRRRSSNVYYLLS